MWVSLRVANLKLTAILDDTCLISYLFLLFYLYLLLTTFYLLIYLFRISNYLQSPTKIPISELYYMTHRIVTSCHAILIQQTDIKKDKLQTKLNFDRIISHTFQYIIE
jgi:hypothetical protein